MELAGAGVGGEIARLGGAGDGDACEVEGGRLGLRWGAVVQIQVTVGLTMNVPLYVGTGMGANEGSEKRFLLDEQVVVVNANRISSTLIGMMQDRPMDWTCGWDDQFDFFMSLAVGVVDAFLFLSTIATQTMT